MNRVYFKNTVVIITIFPMYFIQYFVSQSYIRFFGVMIVSILWLIIVIYLFGMSKTEIEKVKMSLHKIYSYIKYRFI